MGLKSLPWQSVDYVGGNPLKELVRNRNHTFLGDISLTVRITSVSQPDGYWLETAYPSPGHDSTAVVRILCIRKQSPHGVNSPMNGY